MPLFSKNLLHLEKPLLYSPSLPTGGETNDTINRQLFFLWLDNAFEFDLRPLTIGSLTNPPATLPIPSNARGRVSPDPSRCRLALNALPFSARRTRIRSPRKPSSNAPTNGCWTSSNQRRKRWTN